MLSIVLYGRNDSYGYNLHKRAALGLNCMAELLDDPGDEILFVDYNTPDDFPTFPEAIADTLTAKVHARLRVLRVRPALHERFRARSHLQALEPVARNVAVRRSNPANRWILSTNTDMIFVARGDRSLSAIAGALAGGYYHIPRFELPESLWEGFDRLDPVSVIRQVDEYGRSMHLNEVTYAAEEWVKYDAPGDFQLIRREDLFAIDGFDEEMLLGWHLDTNIARRLYLLHGKVGDASGDVLGYHCDHTRQVTPAHEQKAPRNDLKRFSFDVQSPTLPAQRESWGCRSDSVEEIRLTRAIHRQYCDLVTDPALYEGAAPAVPVVPSPDLPPPPYDARHVLPFLVDSFASLPRSLTLAWLGGRSDMLTLFSRAWERLGFSGVILVDHWALQFLPESLPSPVRVVDAARLEAADVFVFDFGAPSISSPSDPNSGDARVLDALFEEFIRNAFLRLAESEAVRSRSQSHRRFICIDSVDNEYHALVRSRLVTAIAPFSVRLRQGFVRQEADSTLPSWHWPLPEQTVESIHRIDLLPLLEPGDGGTRSGVVIVAPFGRRGYACRGPRQRLPMGAYRVDFTVSARSPMALAALVRPIILDVVAGADRLAMCEERFFLSRTIGLQFPIAAADTQKAVELRIFRGRQIDFVITAATLTRVAPAVSRIRPVRPRDDRAQRSLPSGSAAL
jgi:hypothetical protein